MEEWLPWLMPAALIGLWVGLFGLVAWWGGWRALAEAYPAGPPAPGARFRLRSAQLRAGCNYNNCITFVASPAGLRLSLPFPFSVGHPPIFLPWNEIRAHRGRSWWVPVVVLTTAREPAIPIKLQSRLAARLLAAAPDAVAIGDEAPAAAVPREGSGGGHR